jgi:AraC-like DNA-binding protein
VNKGLLSSHRFSTLDLPERSQFDAWRTLMSVSVELTRLEGEPGFPAELAAWEFGGLVLAEMRMPRRGFHRAWRHLKQPLADHWSLVLVLDGQSATGAPARSLSFRSLARPFASRGDEAHLLTLFLPRDRFADVAARFDYAPADIPDEALGALLADFMICLSRRLPELSDADVPAVVEATCATVTACLAPSAEHLSLAARPLALTIVERARQEIQRHIEAQGFGAIELCRALGVSRSRLYRLFEPFGGVATYIRRQRLLSAHAALSDPCEVRQIREIGDAVGFVDASSFSRAFHA